jgi:hypothetical protein
MMKAILLIWRAARPLLPALARDVAGFAGACIVAVGIGEIYAPAGHIAVGIMLLASAMLLARQS